MSDLKVGDVVKDPTLLLGGERVEWADDPGPSWALWLPEHGCHWNPRVYDTGLRILALPPKARVLRTCALCGEDVHDENVHVNECRRALPPKAGEVVEVPCAPEGLVEFLRPKCAPSCTPAEPCCTERVCPVWREPRTPRRYGVPSDFPAARPPRFLPLQHAGNGGFAIWGRTEADRRGDFCIHHGTHHCPHCALPTLGEACEVIRGLLGATLPAMSREQATVAARDFLWRVERK